jgi:hypothetical protein
MGTTDIFLLVILASVLTVGFFWGAARSLILLGGWFFIFVAGAYLQDELGRYLSGQWPFKASFSVMAAYGILYAGALVAAPIMIIMFTRGSQRLSRFQVLDDLVGAFFAVFVAVLGIAGVMIILATYYGTGQEAVSVVGGPPWTAQLYQGLIDSNIGAGISDMLIPIIGVILGPILPEKVRVVFA